MSMVLAVDAGNSNIVLGVFDGKGWIHQWRIETEQFTERHRLDDEIESNLESLKFNRAIVSSVVPAVTERLMKDIKNAGGITPMLFTADTDTGIKLNTDNPGEVGTDIIANAAGAYYRFKESCIIVDFGTATTVMVVEEPGILAGGAICAGLETSVKALIGNTAQLSDFPLDVPPKAMGASTVEAMQSGLVLGHIAMVEGLVERMKEEAGAGKVIATGGLSTLLGAHTDIFDEVDRMLTLNGLRIILERQEGKRQT